MTTDAVLVSWQSTTPLTADEIAAAVAVLSDEERARYDAMRSADGARDYAAAHALLRQLLSHGNLTSPRDWRFDKTTTGKPFLIGRSRPLPSFSLSHTRGCVGCAVAPDIVGIDVEHADREVNIARVAERFFSAEEARALERLDSRARRERFFDVWTLKEALIKAIGGELSSSVRAHVFRIDETSASRRIELAAPTALDPARWQFELFTPVPGYRAAIAARREPGRPRPVTIVNAADFVP